MNQTWTGQERGAAGERLERISLITLELGREAQNKSSAWRQQERGGELNSEKYVKQRWD